MSRLGHGWEEVPRRMKRTPRSAATSLYVFPRSRKYPIGDLYHARMALGGPFASSAYTTPAQRKKILRAVAEAYPDFDWADYWNTHIVGQKKPTPAKRGGKKKYPLYGWDRSVGNTSARRKAANPRRNTMARRRNTPRRKNYGTMRVLENPYGLRLGKGQAVVVDYRNEKRPKGQRVHIRKGLKDEALCGAGKPSRGKKRGVIASKAKIITCYRCIKIRVMDRGDDIERKLVARPSKRSTHMMIPGGREGVYVSGVKPADMVGGEPFFLGGPEEHPSQTRMLTARQKAKRRADLERGRSRKVRAGRSIVQRGEMVANPRSYSQGYDKGMSDYASPNPSLPASSLRKRSLSYQEGYLEGYADASYGEPKQFSGKKKRTSTQKKRSLKKMSAYNRHVQQEMRKGKTMRQAAASWRRRR